MPFRTVFFGSSEFAVPALEAVAQKHKVVAVYTQPDRPAGRHLEMRPTPVKIAAQSLGIDVFSPEKLDSAFVSLVEGLHPQVLVCAAYGKILPRALLDVAGMSALNVHPSLLPRYRGPAPIQAALRDGVSETGVTIIWMSSEMDAGDIAIARTESIEPKDDFGTLSRRLARLGAQALLDALDRLEENTLPRLPQEDGAATYAKPLKASDRELRFDRPAAELANLVRSLSPAPGARMTFGGKRLKVLKARAEAIAPADQAVSPGTLLTAGGDGPLVASGSGALRLLRVVPEGRHEMSGAEFARGLHSRPNH